jgi:hypothetical protein
MVVGRSTTVGVWLRSGVSFTPLSRSPSGPASALELHVAKQAVSHQIKALEKTAGHRHGFALGFGGYGRGRLVSTVA